MRKLFILEILSNPNDPAPRLIFADWLEERGDDQKAKRLRHEDFNPKNMFNRVSDNYGMDGKGIGNRGSLGGDGDGNGWLNGVGYGSRGMGNGWGDGWGNDNGDGWGNGNGNGLGNSNGSSGNGDGWGLANFGQLIVLGINQ